MAIKAKKAKQSRKKKSASKSPKPAKVAVNQAPKKAVGMPVYQKLARLVGANTKQRLGTIRSFGGDLFHYLKTTGGRVRRLRSKLPVNPLRHHPELVLVCAIVAGVLLFQTPLIKRAPAFPIVVQPTETWCSQCRASRIKIPTIKFEDLSIMQMQFDESQKTWPTPVTGIATPKETVNGNIIIFGHSKWFGEVSPYAAISKLKPNDEIIITDQFGKDHTFTVKKLELVDRNVGDAVHAKKELTLTLLTSARYNGEWLLPTQVDPATVDTTKNSQDYAIFVVTASPK